MTLGPAQRAQLVESVLEGRASPNTDATLAKDATGPGSFAAFVQQCWRIVEPAEPLQWNWYLDLLCRELEKVMRGETRDLLINVPPGFAKSLLVSVLFPAWWWLHDPQKRFLTVSCVEELALRDNGRMRELVESEWYQRLVLYMEEEHGIPRWTLARGENQKRNYKNAHKGLRQCFGLNGSIIGFRGHGMIVDDPHDINHILGDPATVRRHMDETWRVINGVLDSRVINRKKRFRIFIMQRLDENDVAGRLLRQGRVVHIVLPMRFNPNHPYRHPEDPRTEEGELLDPVLRPEEEVRQEEEALDVVPGQKEAQHGQLPIRAGGALYDIQWTEQRYDFDPQRPDMRFEKIAVSVDTTFKATRTSAYVSIQVWGIRKSQRYLLDEVYEKMDYVAFRQALRDINEKWHPYVIVVEEKANGPAVISDLQEEIPCVVGFSPDGYGDKYLRAQLAAPVWKARNVHLPAPQWMPTVGGFVAHLLGFPSIGRDRMDSMSQMFLYWAEEAKTGNDGNLIDFMNSMVESLAEGWEG